MCAMDSLHPSRKIICGSQDTFMLFRGIGCNFSYDVYSQLFEWSGYGHFLEWNSFLLLPTNAYLKIFTFPGIA
jgi:hypothetical protein